MGWQASVATADQFGDAVMRDFQLRREGGWSIQASASPPSLETRGLGHPRFEELEVGERRSASLAVAFIDLTDFTGRSFWDDDDEVVDLAHSVLTGFVEVVTSWGGYALGLRGDGLFAGFGPGDPEIDAVWALTACAHALNGVENGLNPRLKAAGIEPVQARAGVDYGRLTFVRSGSRERNEVNVIGFAANFAAKCEKRAKSWEVVAGEGIQKLMPDAPSLDEHEMSPKKYQQDYGIRYYRFYDYRWRTALKHIPGALKQISGHPTNRISIR